MRFPAGSLTANIPALAVGRFSRLLEVIMSANSGNRSAADASTLIHNARIYCFDEGDSTADSILIQAGRVAAIGRRSDLINLTDATKTLDLGGATVLPGL